MRRLLVMGVVVLALAGCGNTLTVLHNPTTGQTAECKGFFWGQDKPSRDTEVCIEYYEKLGFQLVTQ
jgi:hypothetical protein